MDGRLVLIFNKRLRIPPVLDLSQDDLNVLVTDDWYPQWPKRNPTQRKQVVKKKPTQKLQGLLWSSLRSHIVTPSVFYWSYGLIIIY